MNMANDDIAAIRVLSVDDHPLMHQGIAAIIDNESDMAMIARAADGAGALDMFRVHRPDITLMDLRLPDMTGIDATASILKEFPGARIIILTMSSGDVEISRALKAGASGYMLKTMPPKELVEVIRKVHKGRKHIPAEVAANLAEHMGEEFLTERETEVLSLIGGGNRNRDIAEKLFISEETVKVHVRHIMDKLGASDRTEAVAIGMRRGIIQL
jgi:DNA-binding NarL/FixJ family response regulator